MGQQQPTAKRVAMVIRTHDIILNSVSIDMLVIHIELIAREPHIIIEQSFTSKSQGRLTLLLVICISRSINF